MDSRFLVIIIYSLILLNEEIQILSNNLSKTVKTRMPDRTKLKSKVLATLTT